jgi:hypothetical protein
MKKSLLLIGLLMASAGVFAQKISYGINGGLNFSQISASVGGITASSDNLTGFHIGGVIDFKFQSFSIQPGVFYTTKGGNSSTVDGSQSAGANASKVTFNYLEIPVNFLYHTPARKGSVFLGGGPYVAFGLSGSAPLVTDANGQPTNQTLPVHFGSGQNDIHDPDFGINFLAGYQFEGNVTLSAGYGIGLSSLSNTNEVAIHNRVLSFSLGYFFK